MKSVMSCAGRDLESMYPIHSGEAAFILTAPFPLPFFTYRLRRRQDRVKPVAQLPTGSRTDGARPYIHTYGVVDNTLSRQCFLPFIDR